MISEKSIFQVTPYEVYKISKTVLEDTYINKALHLLFFIVTFLKF